MRETFEDYGQYRWCIVSNEFVVGGRIITTWFNGKGLVHGYTISGDKLPQVLFDGLVEAAVNPQDYQADVARKDVFFCKEKATKELFQRRLRGEFNGS